MTAIIPPGYLADDRLLSLVTETRDQMFPRESGPVSEATAVTVLSKLAHEAYRWGRHRAIAELLTSTQAAEVLGISKQRLSALARSREAGWQVGSERLFRPEDIDALRIRMPGRPRKTP